MSNVCSICTDRNRLAIDREIVKGGSLAKIAKEFQVPYHSLYAHAQDHISRQLSKVFAKQELIVGNELLETINKIISRAEKIFQRNFDAKKDVTALKALDSQRNTIQLLSNISAQLHAAKIAELQLQKDKSGQLEEEKQIKFQEDIKILAFEELKVYQRIVNKINHQNNERIISGNRVITKKGIYQRN